MADASAARPAYDAIAHLYDVDMARNMPFADVELYAQICRAADGPALELGCGNGRILLELLAQHLDVVGVDGSAAMLTTLVAKAAARALPPPRVCRMDVRRLGLRPGFAVVLCPYSLVTYMTAGNDARALLDEARRVLAPGGVVVVDAFVPRPVVPGEAFTQDYARPFREGMLVRSKRITRLAPRVNRIERRYEVRAADGTLAEQIDTIEDIREFAPHDVTALVEACGLRVRDAWWDYAAKAPSSDARFFTVTAVAA